MPSQTVQSAPTRTMQGIAVPSESVNPGLFFELTRRHQTPEKTLTYGGGGVTQVVELRKADILSSITLRFVGSLVITGGTANSTAAWPLGIAGTRFTANGQSNLINTGIATPAGGGLQHLRVRDFMKKSDLTDRGVSASIGGVTRTQGTLMLAHESGGVGTSQSAIAAGTYPVELTFSIPVSEDEKDLVGAIFLQTATSDLTLSIDETPLNQLVYAVTATNVALTGQWQVSTTKFSVPVGPNGQIVIPNLNVFHSIIASRFANGISNGENETRLIGQGAGKSLLRVWGRTVSGATTASAPLPVTSTNYGQLSWRYGNNETPDQFLDGSTMRADCERRYNTDVGGYAGYWCHDFAHENVFRDTVDMGTTSELRLVTTIQNAVTLASPALEYVTETVFLAA
jgi:hypothetical protein